MNYPQRFSNLPEYAFPRLRTLLKGVDPSSKAVIDMTIGSPRHAAPDFVASVLAQHVDGFRGYPPNEGHPDLLAAVGGFLLRRYGVSVEPERILALNGTREGLFNAALALSAEMKGENRPIILMPNPFYQVYAVASVTANAEPLYVNATAELGHLPNFSGLPEETLKRVSIAYICSPANPQGAVADEAYWLELFAMAERYDFRIFADECYSEVYTDKPPIGALEVADKHGFDQERLVIFHSLSKRSNLAGLRSGFAVAGSDAMKKMRQLRAYAGAPLPLPLQMVAAKAWEDDTHVEASRALYKEKFSAAKDTLGDIPGVEIPKAGFFLWLPVARSEEATLKLWQEQSVKVLPGAYLARDTEDGNPGDGFIRLALVGPIDETREALHRVRQCLFT